MNTLKPAGSRLLAALLALALAVLACNGAAAPGGTPLAAATAPPAASSAGPTLVANASVTAPATAPAGATVVATAALRPTLAPNPLKVQVNPDSAHAAGAVISADGGTLSASAADGTRFTLSVPAGALLSDQAITLTPVSAIGGLPLSGGLLASAALEPEGLQLLEPATLTVTLPSAPDLKDLQGFAYDGGGAEFRLYPVWVNGSTLTAPIQHFSGYGAGTGNASGAGQHPPTGAERQAEAGMGEAMAECRANGCDPNHDPQLRATLAALLREWYQTSVRPNVTQAETDDTMLDSAALEFLHWLRYVAIFFGTLDTDENGRPVGDHPFANEIVASFTSLAKGVNNAIKKSHERCVAKKDITEVRVMLQRGSLGSRLGLQKYGLDLDAMWERVYKCAHFELEFKSEIDQTIANPAESVQALVQAAVALKWETGLHHLSGEGPLEYSHYFDDLAGCSSPSSAPEGSTFKALALTFLWNLNFFPAHPPAEPPPLTLIMQPGQPLEHLSHTCGGFTASLYDQPPGYWDANFQRLHQDELRTDLGDLSGYVIQGWEYVGGAVFATKTYQRTQTVYGATDTETTKLTLKFTPQP